MSPPTLLPLESWDRAAPFFPPPTPPAQDLQWLVQTLLRLPGKYQSPLVWQERLWLKLLTVTEMVIGRDLSRYFASSDRPETPPLHWQILLRYLAREKVIESDRAQRLHYPVAHDYLKYFFCGLWEVSIPNSRAEPVMGSAYGEGYEITISKAVGEMLERFFMKHTQGTITASASVMREKGLRFLSPESVSQFDAEQQARFPRFRYSNQAVFSWVEGWEPATQEKILIPEQCVSHYMSPDKGTALLRQPTSNGSAGHFTLVEAMLAGLYENIERDGFMIFWLNGIAPPRLDLGHGVDPSLQSLIQRAESYLFEIRFLNTTSELSVPSVICVLIDRSHEGPKLSIGGGCGWDIAKIMRSAFFEAVSVSRLKPVQTSELNDAYIPFADFKLGRRERLSLWHNPAMFPKIEPWLSGPLQSLSEAFPNLPHFNSVQEEYQAALERFRKLGPGYEIYVYERKHPVLTKLGYHVVKVLVPELVHLYLNEAYASLGAKRLKTVPPKLGYGVATEWNPWPHPFP